MTHTKECSKEIDKLDASAARVIKLVAELARAEADRDLLQLQVRKFHDKECAPVQSWQARRELKQG